ncbi:hypothetical protein PBY51_018704 [Eleginops maclovinus]|uniref:Meiotic recombination protein REC114 n=1 Tax=Eleginops maclovinus TaxID=56733 RepID=A0AAN7Y8C8_ELEMC|nr:hypothetical protein PBY51_018704 [Eleginops maclovinus]
MATSHTWTLKRYGRYLPRSTAGNPWKVFEANADKSDILLKLVESGYMLIFQGHESLDAVPLLSGTTVFKGEKRMMRMQFDGRSMKEAIKECSSAVKKLMEYVSVTAEDDTPLPPNQSPAEVPAPVIQNLQGKAVGAEPEVAQGSLTIKRLAQHIMGEHALTLPQMYRNNSSTQGDLEPMLRVFLLDPSFHAFVDKVEGELKKLLQE